MSQDERAFQPSGSTTCKKIRMTMACERSPCPYDGSSTRIDVFHLMKLRETVSVLEAQIQSIERDLGDVRSKRHHNLLDCQAPWSLSLTPQGLRIDTNIISLPDLHALLLIGMSKLSSCLIGNSKAKEDQIIVDSYDDRTTTLVRKKEPWKSHLKVFPLSSTWEESRGHDQSGHTNQFRDEITADELDHSAVQNMVEIYDKCFLCLPCTPDNSIPQRFQSNALDPLLFYAIMAWSVHHGAVHHHLFPGHDPNRVGEPYFEKARELLKARFIVTSFDTMHSLLVMAIYAGGKKGGDRPSQTESEGSIYLGLAVRMCLDLKMHSPSKHHATLEVKRNSRMIWALYFIESLCLIYTDRTSSLRSEGMLQIAYPSLIGDEDDETMYRVKFMIHRHKITRIYRLMMDKIAEEKPLLESVLEIDKELKAWWGSPAATSAYIKLNAEYNYQRCQLYRLFSRADLEYQASAVKLVSSDVCLQAANTLVELLECWVQLDQTWCHFSLETFMMAVMIYGGFLEPTSGQQAYGQHQLYKITILLKASTVRYHSYVVGLVNQIESLLPTYSPSAVYCPGTLFAASPPLDKELGINSSLEHHDLPETTAPMGVPKFVYGNLMPYYKNDPTLDLHTQDMRTVLSEPKQQYFIPYTQHQRHRNHHHNQEKHQDEKALKYEEEVRATSVSVQHVIPDLSLVPMHPTQQVLNSPLEQIQVVHPLYETTSTITSLLPHPRPELISSLSVPFPSSGLDDYY
ncbi:hypothetical protein J3Q64DRAFT_1838894 [Phycomyces blakesleeanus]|uniref:Xylanolytic transcriptional activator regulatory domain-containing protein n=1 Tax=Phycomyces blakesleeanus TaxID=4837 RepID=A0ABR3AP78_PHYBL